MRKKVTSHPRAPELWYKHKLAWNIGYVFNRDAPNDHSVYRDVNVARHDGQIVIIHWHMIQHLSPTTVLFSMR